MTTFRLTSTLSTLLMLIAAAPAQAQDGDLARGEQYWEVCAACHGQNGEGNETYNAPRLEGQHGWYLKRQLEDFIDGVRGAHEDGPSGQQMASMAATLLTEQAVLDLVAFIGTLSEEN